MRLPTGLILATILTTLAGVSSENILFFFASGTWSHKVSVWPLVTALADRGHNVTFISGHAKQPLNNSKVHDLHSATLERELKAVYGVDRVRNRLAGEELHLWDDNNPVTIQTCESIFQARGDSALDYVLRGGGKFDLVVNNLVLGDCGLIVAHRMRAKLIIFASTPMLTWFYDEFGFPVEPATIPEITGQFHYPMGLWDRLYNYFLPIYWFVRRQFEVYPALEAIMQRGYNLTDTEVPSLLDVERNASLILLSAHYSTDFARSMPPMVVNIGGMQCWKDFEPLTGEFKTIMDGATNGAILIAFGSSVNMATMPEELKNYFLEMIRQFPQVVFIWRWDGPKPADPPKNLVLSKWLPQVQILAHPNCKGFISHAGLNSITEATYSGVPIILLPLFADQDYNAYRIEAAEVGIRLELRELSTTVLADAVRKVLSDDKYLKNMKVLSAILKDRPMNPIETGVYWTEFVLRHSNTNSLKPLQYLPWYQRRQLDVLAVLLIFTSLTFVLIILMGCWIVKYLMRTIMSPKTGKAKTEKGKKLEKKRN